MKKLSILISLFGFLSVTGCTSLPGQYGTFVDINNIDTSSIVNDAVTQMTSVLPPAKNYLHLCKEDSTDRVFNELIDNLRTVGFGFDNNKEAGCFTYVLDHLDKDVYRFSINFNHKQLSRAYILEGGAFKPAGNWSYRNGN